MTNALLVKPGWNNAPAAPPVGPPPNPANTYFVPVGVDQTGATDVTADLQAWINGAADGISGTPNVMKFQPGATYRCETSLNVTNRNWLSFDFNGGTLLRTVTGTVRTNSQLNIGTSATGSGQGITVGTVVGAAGAAGTIKGPNPATSNATNIYTAAVEAQYCILVYGNQTNTLIQGLTMTNTWGDAVYVGPGIGSLTGPWPSGTRATNNKVRFTARQGMSCTAATTTRFDHNDMDSGARHAFDLEPAGANWIVNGVEIDHNTVGWYKLGYTSGGGSGTVENVNIHDETATANALIGLTITVEASGPRSTWTVTDVNFALGGVQGGPAGDGIFTFVRVNGVNVTGCTANAQPGRNYYGIMVTGCTSVSQSGNTFPGAAGALIVRPGVLSISPTSGTGTGGTTVVLTGLNLDLVEGLQFNSVNVPSFTINSPTQITCVTPPCTVRSTTLSTVMGGLAGHDPGGTSTGHLTLNAIQASIVVTNPTQTVTYVKGTDYTLTFNGNQEYQIVSVLHGALVGQTPILVSYSYYGGPIDIGYWDSFTTPGQLGAGDGNAYTYTDP